MQSAEVQTYFVRTKQLPTEQVVLLYRRLELFTDICKILCHFLNIPQILLFTYGDKFLFVFFFSFFYQKFISPSLMLFYGGKSYPKPI